MKIYFWKNNFLFRHVAFLTLLLTMASYPKSALACPGSCEGGSGRNQNQSDRSGFEFFRDVIDPIVDNLVELIEGSGGAESIGKAISEAKDVKGTLEGAGAALEGAGKGAGAALEGAGKGAAEIIRAWKDPSGSGNQQGSPSPSSSGNQKGSPSSINNSIGNDIRLVGLNIEYFNANLESLLPSPSKNLVNISALAPTNASAQKLQNSMSGLLKKLDEIPNDNAEVVVAKQNVLNELSKSVVGLEKTNDLIKAINKAVAQSE